MLKPISLAFISEIYPDEFDTIGVIIGIGAKY
jgi:hypothetical protein